MIRFLLDEHITRRIQFAVWHQRTGLDILRVGDSDAPRYGTDDAELLQFAEQHGRMFITRDTHTLRGPHGHLAQHHAQGNHTWGVAFVRPSAALIDFANTLILIAEASTRDDWRDQELWIPF